MAKKFNLSKTYIIAGTAFGPGENIELDKEQARMMLDNHGIRPNDGAQGKAAPVAPPIVKEPADEFDQEDVALIAETEGIDEAEVRSKYTPSATVAKAAGIREELEDEPTGGLPDDFPAREILLAADLDTIEKVQGKTKAELIEIEHIGENRADAILAYLQDLNKE